MRTSDIILQPIDFARRRDRNRFIDVPFHLYDDYPNWVPPLRFSLAALLNPLKNPFFNRAQIAGWIALKNGRPVGRIAGIVNPAHNEFYEDRVGFFGYFECVEDPALSDELFNRVAAWLRERGMDTMRGPMNPSTNDECGLLIDAFDLPPKIMMPYNPPYYADLIESYGFRKEQDLYAILIRRMDGLDERIFRIADRLEQRMNLTIRQIDLKNIRVELSTFKDIYHRSWERNWGFVPLSDEELDYAANDLKEAILPSSSLFVEAEGRVIGMCVCLYDLNEIFRRNPNGRLFPFGLWRLMAGKKKIEGARIVLLGVAPEYRGRGLDAVLYAHIFRNATIQDGMTHGEMSWVLESNRNMIEGGEKMGGRIYKTYRIYDFPLD